MATTPITKVIIIDDSPIIVSRLKQQIDALAMAEICGVATNISDSLQLVATAKPQVAILDIYLKDDAPGNSGITLLSMLRSSYNDMKIIMLTNLSGEPYSTKCLELGADYFLDKSIDFERIPELLLQIHQTLNPVVL